MNRDKRIMFKQKVGNKTLAKVTCDRCSMDYFEVLKEKKYQGFYCEDCKEDIRRIHLEKNER